MGDEGGPDFGDLGGILFGYLVYREIRDGRLDADGCLRAGCLLALMVGAVLGGGLLLVGAFATPRYGGGEVPYRTPAVVATQRPAAVPPVTARPTERAPAPSPTLAASPTPEPTSLPGVGKRVAGSDGWAVTVTKVRRWRPAWYDEPGWRLLTVHVKVRMPAVEDGCVFPSSFSLAARSGRSYEAREWQRVREPQLFECADYHRPTSAQGWVTFEVRDADAKGLVLLVCLPAYGWCETPATIRL